MAEPARRISEQLLVYWNALRKGKKLPALEDIRSQEIPHIWEDCFIAHVRHHPETGKRTHRYVFLGNEIDRMLGGGIQSAFVLSLLDALTQKYRHVADNVSPVIDESEHLSPDNNKVVRYRQAIAPLGTPEGEVTHLVIAMRCKVFNEA